MTDLAERPSTRPARSDLAAVLDLPVTITAVLGEARLSVGAVAALAPGDVVELDRRVGDPVDLYVNDRLVARGDLALVDGRVGVTITELVSAA